MKKSLAAAAIVLGLTPALAFAHHGWGSYDIAKKFTIESPIESVAWQNPHVHVMLKYQEATWEVTLAPISRMVRRGVEETMLKPGVTISAEGYPSTRNEHEMRAERITIDGKIYEMR
ncbi:MAG: DUF6152 family protein [Hyphomicrobiales bacterium]